MTDRGHSTIMFRNQGANELSCGCVFYETPETIHVVRICKEIEKEMTLDPDNGGEVLFDHIWEISKQE